MKPEQVESLLTAFAQECFIGGHAAYQLDDGSFSIDAGENDVRAIYDEDNTAIKFFCRYKRDMRFYDNKLQTFAAKHGIDTTLTCLQLNSNSGVTIL
ncbi:hypothetical protein [Arsukibacterium tuosuense]|uniref:hypothetical protein n=1 Tax=Arsukibacterium tuosuense TaxID=1323745 RepID=UPI0014828ADC|nr:hypothetical protein [Arsukibacterium tuosuense]